MFTFYVVLEHLKSPNYKRYRAPDVAGLAVGGGDGGQAERRGEALGRLRDDPGECSVQDHVRFLKLPLAQRDVVLLTHCQQWFMVSKLVEILR